MNEEKHKLEKLESKLYSRSHTVEAKYKSHTLEPKSWETNQKWEDTEGGNVVDSGKIEMKKIKNPFYKLLLGSFAFLAVSILIAGFIIMRGGNSVSPDNINITMGGPIQIGGGQELALDIGVENRNNIPIELVDLVVDYPPGTKTSDESRSDLKRDRVNLGDIKSGGFAHKIFKASLFGEEGSSKDIKVSIEYRVSGSNAIFEKNKTFSILLNSSPVAIVTKGIKEITSGQDAEFEITISSNSEKPLKNIVLKADYPFGYLFKEATPKPQEDNSTWKLGTLAPKESRVIKVKGSLQGQNDEERYFKFTVGNASQSDDKEVGTVLALSSQSMAVKKPFIGTELTFGQSEGDIYSARDGETVHAEVSWVNNTSNTIANSEFNVYLSGAPLDESSVFVSDGGFYDSSKNIITWNKKTNNNLAEMYPGDTGKLSFTFVLRAGKGDPQVKVDVSAKGQRISESNVAQEINSNISKVVKLTSDLHLASQAVYFVSPLENSGPIPPRSEQETTYTIIWTVTNTINTISGAKVSARLPSYVSWNNVKTPSSEKITFDSVGGEVVWDVGNVPIDTGFSKPKREVAFQITLKPSITQVDSTPILLSPQVLVGHDNYANTEVRDERSSLTTRLTGDVGFTESDDKVRP